MHAINVTQLLLVIATAFVARKLEFTESCKNLFIVISGQNSEVLPVGRNYFDCCFALIIISKKRDAFIENKRQ